MALLRQTVLRVGAVLLAAAALAGCAGSHSQPASLSTARFGNGISLRYPATWTRVNWCQSGMHVSPIALLTTARPGPTCNASAPSVYWPPRVQLDANGVAVTLADFAPPAGGGLAGFVANGRIAGVPAYLTKPAYGGVFTAQLSCPAGGRREVRGAYVGGLEVDAVICGPRLAAGEATVRALIKSIRFAATEPLRERRSS